MAAELLVEDRIGDGQRLIDQLSRDDIEIATAFWAKSAEEGLWSLYIASPLADDPGKLGDAYRRVFNSLSKLPESGIQLSEIKIVSPSTPIARGAIEIRDRNPAKSPVRYQGRRLGNLSTEEAYIYAPPGKWFRGFDEIKRNFPSAETFTISANSGDLLASLPYANCINAAEFEGKPPGTVLYCTRSGSR